MCSYSDRWPILEWAKDTWIADEHVIATLSRISETTQMEDGTWIVRQDNVPEPGYHLALWYEGCRGLYRHSVCVFSLLDLSTIVSAQSIRINKVMSDKDPSLAECVRDSMRRRERLK